MQILLLVFGFVFGPGIACIQKFLKFQKQNIAQPGYLSRLLSEGHKILTPFTFPPFPHSPVSLNRE